MSLLHRSGDLVAERSFKLTTFPAAHLIQGTPPSPYPFPQLGAVSPAPWMPHIMLGTNSVVPHPSFFSPQLVGEGRGRRWKLIEKERHRVTGVKGSLAPGVQGKLQS